MSTAFDVRATFSHFIADNVGSVPVHALRHDPNDPGADTLKNNAINIQFLSLYLDTIGNQQIVIDVLNDDENVAADWMWTLWTILRSAFYTTLMDYTTNPTSPVSKNTNLMWEHSSVKFSRVANEYYVHYTCILPVKFDASN